MKATLPSVVAAEAFWRNEPGALGRVAWSMAERGAIIAAALLIMGERQKVLPYTLAVSAAIELVVLWQVKQQLNTR